MQCILQLSSEFLINHCFQILTDLHTFCLQILDKLLDRESQTHKPQTLSSFYSSKPATGSQKSPSKHATHGSSATGSVSKHAAPATSGGSTSVQGASGGGVAGQQGGLTGSGVQGTASGEAANESREQGEFLRAIRKLTCLPSLHLKQAMKSYYIHIKMQCNWDSYVT